MAPKSPWKTNTQNKKNHDLKPAAGNRSVAGHTDGASVNYAEVQADEVDVLQAIYMEDYEELEIKNAWSKTTDRAFKIKLKAFSDEKTFVVLSVKLTATYPKSPPILQVDGLEKLQAFAQKIITHAIQSRPVELAGEVMIHTIASDIQEALEDAVQSREQGALPSLEDERMIQEATANEQAEKAEADEAKKLQAVQDEEDRLLQQMVQDEVERRGAKRRIKSDRKSDSLEALDAQEDANFLQFDQTITTATRADASTFNAVALISTVTSKGDMTIFSAQAKPADGSDVNQNMLAVRRVRLAIPHGDTVSRSNLLALEEELEALKTLRQQNAVNVFAFKIEKSELGTDISSQNWSISILVELSNRGSLSEMLEDGQTIPLQRARQWSLDLLEALDYYHRHGIVHKRIHSGNVLFFRSETGTTTPKLADAAYEDRLLKLQGRPSIAEKGKKLAAWLAPECTGDNPALTRRSDVWDFGVLLIQMLFGISATRKYSGPGVMLDALNLSEPLHDVMHKVFSRDAKNRPSAFDLIPSEFFRNDVPLMAEQSTSGRRRQSSSIGYSGQKSPNLKRSRHNSLGITEAPSLSRYGNDFTELGRLGKGGFGEVVKARNKLDGGMYAIKKVKQDSAAQLEQVLSEVMLLHRLNHAYVVRYYSAWVEDDFSGVVELDEDSVSMSEELTTSTSDDPRFDFGMSSQGLDFVSSNGYNDIQFGEDSDDDEDDDEDDGDEVGTASGTETDARPNAQLGMFRTMHTESAVDDTEDTDSQAPKKFRSTSRRIVRSTLYIQMEYCERHTLRDLIRKDMYTKPEEGWQMLRQILEGLAHIHSHGIIHRDLKPDNIFIDMVGNPRIGDFGLATTSQYLAADKVLSSSNTGGDMTKSIGTALYVAPEVKSGSGSSYNDKVDMYSLGVIFFEMCVPLRTAMERHEVLTKLREKDFQLPHELQTGDKSLQGNIITSLISHAPSSRPSSLELLRGGKLPVQIEDETIRQALQSLSDSGSPYYQKMMTALFSQTPDQQVKDYAWDVKTSKSAAFSAADLRMRDIARQTLCAIFRRHGAEETARPLLLPRSSYYTAPNIVQLLDGTGNLLQLPFDLILPHARQLARQTPLVEKTFVFGNVFRDSLSGGPPRSIGEVDFDIVTKESDDLALQEAEVMKVVDEIIEEVPALSNSSMCFHINHSDLLDLVLDYCRIDKSQRPAVKETLSKLNIHQFTWPKIRAELRSPLLGVHSTSIDDLAQFDFRETPDKIIGKLQAILEGSTHVSRIRRPLEHISRAVEAMKLFGVRRKIYICPLSSVNEKFYIGSLLFQCIHDKKNRSVFAAGGRYDRLIEAHTRGAVTSPHYRAVGVSIGWDGLVAAIARHQTNSASNAYSNAYLKKGGPEESLPPAWSVKRVSLYAFSPRSAVQLISPHSATFSLPPAIQPSSDQVA